MSPRQKKQNYFFYEEEVKEMPKMLRVSQKEAKIQDYLVPILAITGKKDQISHEMIPGCLNLKTN